MKATNPTGTRERKKRTSSTYEIARYVHCDHFTSGNPLTHGEIRRLGTSVIDIGWRIRSDLGDVDDLADSIRAIGQIQPITVQSKPNGRFEIISGVRRLTACEKLGIDVAAYIVSPLGSFHGLDAQLEENLSRKNFDRLELAEGLSRRKEIYEEKFPETVNGAVGNHGKSVTKESIAQGDGRSKPQDRFARDAAKRLGLSETRVRDLMKLAHLPDDVKEAVKELPTTKERNYAIEACMKEQKIEAKKEKLKAKIVEVRDKIAQNPELFIDPRVEIFHASNLDWLEKQNKTDTFDLILTDPPYESGRTSIIQHDRRSDIKTNFGDWDILDVKWVKRFHHLLNPGGQMLIFCPLESIGDYKAIIESEGLTYRGAIIWKKTNPGTVHRPVYLSACEAIVWATIGGDYHFRPWDNAGAPEVHNTIDGPICGGNERIGEHPTQKPLWIIERLLNRHAMIGHRVLDPFAGTGTTAAACKRLGIGCVAVEQAELFYNTAVLRVNAIVPGEGVTQDLACAV